MRISVLLAGLLACFTAQAQDSNNSFENVYVGLGAPSILSVGYAKPINNSWGMRAEFAMTPKLTYNDSVSGGSASLSFKSTRIGLFADWFPFDNQLRLVGGLTFNDIQGDFSGTSTATNFVTVNNKKVSLAGENYNASLTFPAATPYIGVGLGHNPKKDKGLGFHADVGLMIGSFTSSINTSVLNKNIGGVVITQADIDRESQLVKDAISNIGVLPSLSLGLSYRF
jgi:hypothetical protein